MARGAIKKRGVRVPLEGDNAGALGTNKSPAALAEGGQDAEKHKVGKAKKGRSAGIVTRGKGA